MLLTAALVASGAGAATTATQTPIVVRAGVDAQAAEEIKTSKPELSKTFELTNTTSSPVSITLIPRATSTSFNRECGPTSDCTLGWSIDGVALPANRAIVKPIPADSSIALVYSGKMAERGSYQSEVSFRLADTQTPPGPARIRVVQAPLNLGDGAISIGPVGRLTWSFSPLAGVGSVPVAIKNGGVETVTLPTNLKALLRTDDGSGNYPDDAGTAPISCPSWAVAPQGVAHCEMLIGAWTSAGRYRARLPLNEEHFEAKEATADFSVRYPAAFCFILLVIGGFGGAWLAGYQNSGRRRALQTADLLELRDTFRAIRNELPAGSAPDALGEVAKILSELNDMQGELARKRNADFAERLDALAKRAPFLHRFGSLEQRFHALDEAAQQSIGDDYKASHAAALAPTLPDDADALLSTLEAKLSDTQAELAEDDASAKSPPPYPEFFFRIWRARSAEHLRESIGRIDTILLVVGIVLASLVGIITLWRPSAAWGSLPDVMVALFTGASVVLTGAVGLQQLVKSYALGKIGGT